MNALFELGLFGFLSTAIPSLFCPMAQVVESGLDLGHSLGKMQVSKLQKSWRPTRKNLNEIMSDLCSKVVLWFTFKQRSS